ncbi:MAG: hypothetical protein CMK32_14225 [Porticoccaceae bacterium]|nr:hypothetical protein [Porticoccaceae bacterium]
MRTVCDATAAKMLRIQGRCGFDHDHEDGRIMVSLKQVRTFNLHGDDSPATKTIEWLVAVGAAI